MSKSLVIAGLIVSFLAAGLSWRLIAEEAEPEKKTSQNEVQITPKEGTATDESQPLEERIKPEPPLVKFMRKKLEASNLVLEGLVTENFGMIAKGAQQMEKMSDAEQWRVSNDAIYRQLSDDFRRITQQLQKDAKKSTIDAASLTWIKATMSCIECHKYTKGMLISSE